MNKTLKRVKKVQVFLFALIAAIITLPSCNPDDLPIGNNENPSNVPGKKLIKMKGKSLEYTYTWNQDLLTKVVIKGVDDSTYKHTYDFIYTNRQLVKIIPYLTDSQKEECHYTWKDGKIVEELYLCAFLDGHEGGFGMQYTYDYSNEKISQITQLSSFNDDKSHYTITWKGENVACIKLEEMDYSIEYEYDNGKNPFYLKTIGFHLFDVFSLSPPWSYNNVTKRIIRYGERSDSIKVYNTYDKDGYPTTSTLEYNVETDTYSDTYTYIYDK